MPRTGMSVFATSGKDRVCESILRRGLPNTRGNTTQSRHTPFKCLGTGCCRGVDTPPVTRIDDRIKGETTGQSTMPSYTHCDCSYGGWGASGLVFHEVRHTQCPDHPAAAPDRHRGASFSGVGPLTLRRPTIASVVRHIMCMYMAGTVSTPMEWDGPHDEAPGHPPRIN